EEEIASVRPRLLDAAQHPIDLGIADLAATAGVVRYRFDRRQQPALGVGPCDQLDIDGREAGIPQKGTELPADVRRATATAGSAYQGGPVGGQGLEDHHRPIALGGSST